MFNPLARRRAANKNSHRQLSSARPRRLRLEHLETRLPLAAPTDLALIQGRVFADFDGDGYTPGEEISGASINLFRDNGDGVFNPAADTLVTSATSGTDGRYRFENVTAGNYFVQQPAQTADGRNLQAAASPLINLTANDVAGQLFTVIDSFDAAPQLVFDDTNDGVPVTSSIQGPTAEIIGGQRDVLVNKTSVNGRVQISVNDPLLPGFLSFDSIQTGQGQRIVSWDGIDNDALTLDDTGLGSVDLTSGSAATGLRLEIGADSAAGAATIRIYTDDATAGTASRFSTGVVQIPDTGGEASSLEFLPFTAFAATSGGGADFTRVGAIELEITGAANVNGAANLVGAIGPTQRNFDFDNFATADLRLAIGVNNASPGVGQNVTFTITVTNDGPDGASGVAVRNQLPAELTFVSSAPSQGTYDAATGIWTVGAIPGAGTATLAVTATVVTSGTIINTAEVVTSDQPDPNSTPGNNVPGENDQGSVTVTVASADLSLTKTASNSAPNVFSDVTFTIAVQNAGPTTATGVTVLDPLPAGLSFVSATPPGSYDPANGVWTIGSIAAGATATLQLIATPTVPGTLSNTAEVLTSDQPDPDSIPGNNVPGEDDQATSVIVAQQAELSLVKTVDNPAPDRGQTVVFTLTLANAGPSTATGIQVRDQLPGGLTLQNSTPSTGTFDPATGVWSLPTLASGASATLRLTALVDSVAMLTNTAEVIAADQPDPNSTPGNNIADEDDQASVTITVASADLSLSHVVDNAAPNVGDTVRFTVVVSNAGPDEATGVAARSLLPAGLSFVSSAPSQGTYTPATGRWTIGSISQGASATLELLARVDTPGAKNVTAQVIESDRVDPNSTPGNDVESEDDQDAVTVEPATADLSLAKAVSNAAPNLGESVTFTITVSNGGPDGATGVSVLDVLPAGLAFVSASTSTGAYSAATGVWTIGDIPVGVQPVLQLTATPTAAGEKVNTAELLTADHFDPDSTPGNAVAGEDDQAAVVVSPQLIDLSLTKTVNNPSPNVGQNVTFVLTLANAGPSTATGVQVLDTLPAAVEFISATSTSGNFVASTGIWTPGQIGAGATATLTVIARVNEVGTAVNTAEVTAADQPDVDSTPGNGDPAEDDFASIAFTTPVADLSLTKSVDNATPNRNEIVTFTVVITNSGPDNATGIVVTNRIPANFNFAGSTVTTGVFTPTAGTWVIPALASGSSATLTVSGRATNFTPVVSTAEITRADQSDPDSTPGNADPTEDDFVRVVLTPNAIDLSVNGQIDNLAPQVGDVVTLTFTVNNAGAATATGVALAAAIPPGVTVLDSGTTRGVFDPTTGQWAVGILAPGQSETLSVQLRVDVAGIKLATLQVSAADQFDIDSAPANGIEAEDDQVSVVINAPRLLSLRLFLAR